MDASDQVGLKIHLASKKHVMKLAQTDSAVLKKEFVNKPMENTINVSNQFSAPENGNFRCDICNVELTSQVQLDVHLG